MQARFFSFFILFALLVAVFAAPVAVPEPELASDEGDELDIATRGVSILEPRGSGKATYYNPGVGKGACGKRYPDSALVVAVPPGMYKKGKACGKKMTIKYKGKSVTCRIVDLCPGCASNQLDMSEGSFKKLAKTSVGVIKVSW